MISEAITPGRMALTQMACGPCSIAALGGADDPVLGSDVRAHGGHASEAPHGGPVEDALPVAVDHGAYAVLHPEDDAAEEHVERLCRRALA
jgi:hypothetical protein